MKKNKEMTYQEEKEMQNKIINYILRNHFPFVRRKRKNNLIWYLHNLYGNNLINNKEILKRIKKQNGVK